MAYSSRKRKLFLAAYMFLESSSSSESSDDDEIAYVLQQVRNHAVLARPASLSSYIQAQLNNTTDEEFRKKFRINRVTCGMLISRFRHSEYYPREEHRRGHPPIPPEHHILSFLLFAGKKCILREVADTFGMAESSLHRQIYRVMDFFMWLSTRVINFPQSEEQKRKIEREFKAIEGFPGVLGVIDSTHITVRTPAHSKKNDYKNKNDETSIMLQAIFSAEGRFLDVFAGLPSSTPKHEVLEISLIYKKLPELCGPHRHIIGSAAYPLREYLLVPYVPSSDDEVLTDSQKEFNRKLDATRDSNSNVFDMLKQRFRQLTKLEFHSLDAMTRFVVSCCVLHNLCMNENDLWECTDDSDEEEKEDEVFPYHCDSSRQRRSLRIRGEAKRDAVRMKLTDDVQNNAGTTNSTVVEASTAS